MNLAVSLSENIEMESGNEFFKWNDVKYPLKKVKITDY
jgi:hypothetical protein